MKCAQEGRIIILAVALMMLLTMVAIMPEDVEAQAPGNKDITFYLQNCTSSKQVGAISTMRVMNTSVEDNLNMTAPSLKAVLTDWYLYPVLADDTAISGNVTLHMYAMRTGVSTGAMFRFWLYDIDENGIQIATIATATRNIDPLLSNLSPYTVRATNVPLYNISKGHTMRLYFQLDGSSSNSYSIAFGDSNYRSRVVIEMHDYLRVDSLDVLDHNRVPRSVFPQTASDKTIIFNTNITDPFGGYDIRYVNATLFAPGGTRVLDMAPMGLTEGYFNTYYSEFSLSWNYSGYPTGRYNLTVHAVDNTGYYYRFPTNPGDTTYGGHQESLTTSFWIGGKPHNATVSVVDSSNQSLAGALVSIGQQSGTTNDTGMVVLLVPNGTYELLVFWQDVRVYNGTAMMLGDASFNVTAAVHSPTIIAVDDTGEAVMDAVVVLEHPNGSVIKGYWRTNESGEFGLVQMAGGTYRLSVLWRDVEVWSDPLEITSDGPYTITLRIYSLAVSVVDDVGDGISMAQVVVIDHNTGLVTDSKLTNLTGIAVTRLPVGSFDFTVYWRNVLIFDALQDHVVNASGTILLHANVFQLALSVEDTTGVPIGGANIVVGFAATGEVHDFGTTDGTGGLVTKLPVGSYDIWVYWRDVLVNYTADLQVDEGGTHIIVGDVYWVEVTVLDARDAPVSVAPVTMRHEDGIDFGTKVTADEGKVVYRLPLGSYDVDVRWRDSPVYTGSVLIDSNDPIVLHVAIFYLDLTVVDTKSVPVESAMVTVINTTTSTNMGSAFTDAEGQATFRLPDGRYTATIVWLDTLVYEGNYVVDANLDRQALADVFYVLFRAQDSRDIGLDHAQVVVTNSATNRAMGGRTTDLGGETTYRLPIGEYDVEVRWQQSLVYLDTWTVDADATDVLECRVYYATYHVVDADGMDLVGAEVSLANASAATALGPSSTDASGDVEFRLPAGDVAMTIAWRSVVVYEQDPVSIVGDVTETITAQVYYLSVEVVGSDGASVGNADLNVIRGGEVVASAITQGDGPEVFRLPLGHYSVNMTFRASYLLTRIDITKSEEFDLDADHTVTFKLSKDEFPLPIYKTNLFWLVLAIALMLVLIVFLLYKLRTAAGEPDEEPEAEPEDEEEPEAEPEDEEEPEAEPEDEDVPEGELEEDEDGSYIVKPPR